MKEWLSVSEIAEFTGKPQQTVQDWTQSGLASRKQGRSREINRDHLIRFLAGRDYEPGSQRERLAKAQAEKVELENLTKRGDLVWRWQVQEVMQSMAADISARLDGMPGRVAGEVAGMTDAGEVRERLLDECRSIRSGHAEYVEQLADASEAVATDGEDVSATAEEVAEPVGGPEQSPPARKRRARTVSK